MGVYELVDILGAGLDDQQIARAQHLGAQAGDDAALLADETDHGGRVIALFLQLTRRLSDRRRVLGQRHLGDVIVDLEQVLGRDGGPPLARDQAPAQQRDEGDPQRQGSSCAARSMNRSAGFALFR